MRTILILLSAAILVAFGDAQRKSNFTKPVINLDKRPRPPVWNRPPEERRKLSIFPKTNMKFVVTSKTVKTDEGAKEGLPTKRPVMRKFVMQDKSDKGTWSFVPREPLMKSKRFTVTLAPPRIDNSKAMDEIRADESNKVKTVVDSPIPGRDLSKIHNLNKGNLIEMVQIKKVEPVESKSLEKNEQKFLEEENPELINANDTYALVNKNTEDYVIVNETKHEEENEYDSLNIDQTTVTPITADIEVVSKESTVLDLNDIELPNDQYDNHSLIVDNKENNNDKVEQVLSLSELDILLKNNVSDTEEFHMKPNFNVNDSLNVMKNKTNVAIEDIPVLDVSQPKESRVLDLSDIELPNDQYDNHSLIVDNKENNNDKVEQVLSLSELDILLKNNVSDTEELHMKPNFNVNDSLNVMKNKTNVAIEDIPVLGVSQPNTFYNVTSVSNDDKKENMKEEVSVVTSIQDTQNVLKAVDSGIVSNLENLMQLIEEEALDMKTDKIYLDNIEARKQIESLFGNRSDIDTVETNTEDPTTNSPIKSYVTENFMKNDSEQISGESEVSGELNPVFIDLNSEESFENKSLSSTEMSNESLDNEDSKNTSNDSNGHSNLSAEEINIESNNTTDDDVSNESIRDSSNNYTEELSNASLTDKSNNLTGEDISNESSSNIAAEELSNESIQINDKSNNVKNDTFDNFTGEDISHESDTVSDEWLSNDSLGGSQHMSREEISDEALANRFKRSNNIIEEENLATTVSGFKYKSQETRLNQDLSYKNINA